MTSEEMNIEIFEFATTHKSDYQWPDTKSAFTRANWANSRFEIKDAPRRPPELRNLETLSVWPTGLKPSFTLHWMAKPIVGTYPKFNFTMKDTVHIDSSLVQATRPRVYLTPEVCVDDIPKPQRDHVCDYAYTTTWEYAAKDAALPNKPRLQCNNDEFRIKPGNPVAYAKDIPIILPNGWSSNRVAAYWDAIQSRGVGDSTKRFWLQHPMRDAWDDPEGELVIPEGVANEVVELNHQSKLRWAYKMRDPNYSGYQPRLPKVIPLEKKFDGATDPNLSVNEAYNSRKSVEGCTEGKIQNCPKDCAIKQNEPK